MSPTRKNPWLKEKRRKNLKGKNETTRRIGRGDDRRKGEDRKQSLPFPLDQFLRKNSWFLGDCRSEKGNPRHRSYRANGGNQEYRDTKKKMKGDLLTLES